jgi:hypothetical protein
MGVLAGLQPSKNSSFPSLRAAKPLAETEKKGS